MIFRVEPLLGFDCRATEDTVEPLLLEDVDLKKDSGTPPKIELNMAGAAALEVVEYVAETCDKGECILELRSGGRPYLRLYQNCSGCCSSGNTRTLECDLSYGEFRHRRLHARKFRGQPSQRSWNLATTL